MAAVIRRRRSRRLAATVLAGGMLLVPATLATTTSQTLPQVLAAQAGAAELPVVGDLLAAARRGREGSDPYGVTGRLPTAESPSPDLLTTAATPAATGAVATGAVAITGAGPLASVPPGPLGIPGTVLDAYLRAERTLASAKPGCGLTWSLLAAIGRIESSHARGGAVDVQGTTVRPILGPQLSGGPGMAAIRDTDGGRLDGDTAWDRAVGPMQFIPTSWARYAVDGNGDGVASPHNIYDAALASGYYLCASGGDLRDAGALARAVFSYNHSDAYVRNVLTWANTYAAGVTPLAPTPMPVDQQAFAAPAPNTLPLTGTSQPPTSTSTTPASTTGSSTTGSSTTTGQSTTDQTTTTGQSTTDQTTTTTTERTTTTAEQTTTEQTTTTTTSSEQPTTTTTTTTPSCVPANANPDPTTPPSTEPPPPCDTSSTPPPTSSSETSPSGTSTSSDTSTSNDTSATGTSATPSP